MAGGAYGRPLVEDVACVVGAVGALRDQDGVIAFLPPQRGFPAGRHRGRVRGALPAAAASGSNTAAVPRSHPYGGHALGVEPVLRVAGALRVNGDDGRRADGGGDVIPAVSLDGAVAYRVRALRVSAGVVVIEGLPGGPAPPSRSTGGGASVSVVQGPPPPRAVGGRRLDHRPVLGVRLHPDDGAAAPRDAAGAAQRAGPRGVRVGQDAVAGGALAAPGGAAAAALVQAPGVCLQEAVLLGHGDDLQEARPAVVGPAGRAHLRRPLPVGLRRGVGGRRPVGPSPSPRPRGRGAVVLVRLLRDVDELRGAGARLQRHAGASRDAAAVAGQRGAGARGHLGHVGVAIEAPARVGAGPELHAAVVLRVLGGGGGGGVHGGGEGVRDRRRAFAAAVLALPLREELLGAAGVHGGVVEGGGVAPGRLLVGRHGLGRVDPGEGVAEGHVGVFALRAAGGDGLCGAAALQAVVGAPLEAAVQEALGARGVEAGFARHAGFHLQVVQDGLLADVGQRAGGAGRRRRGAGSALLTGPEAHGDGPYQVDGDGAPQQEAQVHVHGVVLVLDDAGQATDDGADDEGEDEQRLQQLGGVVEFFKPPLRRAHEEPSSEEPSSRGTLVRGTLVMRNPRHEEPSSEEPSSRGTLVTGNPRHEEPSSRGTLVTGNPRQRNPRHGEPSSRGTLVTGNPRQRNPRHKEPSSSPGCRELHIPGMRATINQRRRTRDE
ncbi:hypothetical protein EYF80_053551 [Liparis tanakae]|uniref:Uncharacterized protein n=1 Tax=Liparis tanakae TaxID=230148 RepID=A0A4Z2F6B9_9TELE|nr:hypothetical protein EYF80_053551 [Liparis tanakae]